MKKSSPPKITRFQQAIRFLQVSYLLVRTMQVIYRERCRVMQEQTSGTSVSRLENTALLEAMTRFRDRARSLGILMIKFGQFLSVHVDLLPEQAIAVLSSLQDDVSPVPFEQIVFIVEDELGRPVEEVFSRLEPQCTAAASLGQLHQAVLASTGEVVAVKVQRPNAEQLIGVDLQALKWVSWLITHVVRLNGFIDLPGVLEEFRRTIYEEVDYMCEAAHARRFKEMFKDDPKIYVPRIYDQYVSRKLLVLEWIDGIKISDSHALDAAGISRLEVVSRIARAYFYQLFEAGFFHADPHLGNILVRTDSLCTEPVIAFIDFGMMGSHTKAMKTLLRDALVAVIARDTRLLIKALTRLGFIGKGADIASLESALECLMDRYCDMTSGTLSKVDVIELVQDAIARLYNQPFQIPAQFAFTGRAISMLFGFSTALAPEFNIMEIVLPYARKFLGLDAKGIEMALYHLIVQVMDTGKSLLALPGSLEQVLNQFEKGEIGLEAGNNGSLSLHRWREGRAASSVRNSLCWCWMGIASLAGGIFLLADTHQLVAAWFCLGLSGLTTLRGVLKN